MATIDTYLENIKNKTYGEDVRDAIHDGIQQCYTDATDVVKVSDTPPTSENTRIWIKPVNEDMSVPTWEEHEELADAVSDLKAALNGNVQFQSDRITDIDGYIFPSMEYGYINNDGSISNYHNYIHGSVDLEVGDTVSAIYANVRFSIGMMSGGTWDKKDMSSAADNFTVETAGTYLIHARKPNSTTIAPDEIEGIIGALNIQRPNVETLSELSGLFHAKSSELDNTIDGLENALMEPSKNLFGVRNAHSETKNSVTLALNDDGTFTLTGTATSGTTIENSFGVNLYPLDATNGETLTMSYEIASGSYSGGKVYISLAGQTATTIRLDLKTFSTFEKTSAMSKLTVYCDNGTTFTGDFTIRLQIEKGNIVTPYSQYGYGIANDKVARKAISEINGHITETDSIIFTKDAFTEFEVGILSSGVPLNPTQYKYRLRSVSFVPFDCFYKATWTGAYCMLAACYDSNYSYLGDTSTATGTVFDRSFITNANTKYIKLLFSTNPVGNVTLDVITTANLQIYTFLPNGTAYDLRYTKDEVYLPSTWNVDFRAINQIIGTKFSFCVQTDTHFYNGIPLPYFNSVKNLSRKVAFDFIVNLGDVIRGYEYDTVADSYKAYEEALPGLFDSAGCKTLCLVGNHDNGAMYATVTGDMNDVFKPSELYELMGKRMENSGANIVWGSKTGLYFYIDLEQVRIVVINTSDLPYQEISSSDINVEKFIISSAQLSWLENTALDTDKAVLVLSHAPLSGITTIDNRYEAVQLLKAFVNNGGTLIACVAGHTHQLSASKADGINYIMCDNGGDICEVFAVDLVNRTIKTKLVGNYSETRESDTFTF